MKPNPRKLILLIAAVAAVVTIYAAAPSWQSLVAWFEFQREFEALPINAQGLPEYKHLKTEIIFVKVSGGSFLMGSPDSESGRSLNEGPRKSVKVKSFLISKYELSQEQWTQNMGKNPSYYHGDNFPINSVSWYDSKEFCARTGLSLPTAEQWEYACRAGTKTPFSFGDTVTTDQANYNGVDYYNPTKKGQNLKEPVPVNHLIPNQWGLYNMHGNVWEWCLNEHIDLSVSGSEGKKKRVVRGGSFLNSSEYLRSAQWLSNLPSYRSGSIGFRPVRNLE